MGVPTNGFVKNGEKTSLAKFRLDAEHAAAWHIRVAMLPTRQLEIVRHIADGMENKNIAAVLGISIKTVEKHRQWAYQTLCIHNTATLVRVAVLTGLVSSYVPITEPPRLPPQRKEPSNAKLPNSRK